MNTVEVLLSGFSVVSSFMGSFAGGGSTTLLLGFLLLTSGLPFLTLIALSKLGAFSMVLVSGNMHRKLEFVNWKMCAWLTFFSGVGIVLGTALTEQYFDKTLLKGVVAVTLILLGIYQVFFNERLNHTSRTSRYTRKEMAASAVLVTFFNVINALTGGMGLVFVAFYVSYLRMSFIQATAYSMLAGIPVIGGQTVYLLLKTKPPFWSMVVIVLGSMLGAYLGTRFQYFKGDRWVSKAATGMLFVLAVFMLF